MTEERPNRWSKLSAAKPEKMQRKKEMI